MDIETETSRFWKGWPLLLVLGHTEFLFRCDSYLQGKTDNWWEKCFCCTYYICVSNNCMWLWHVYPSIFHCPESYPGAGMVELAGWPFAHLLCMPYCLAARLWIISWNHRIKPCWEQTADGKSSSLQNQVLFVWKSSAFVRITNTFLRLPKLGHKRNCYLVFSPKLLGNLF